MKKTMILSFFAAFLMTAFAFTPATSSTVENDKAVFSACTGFIQASIDCVTQDLPATITIRNIDTGAVVYTGPANGKVVDLTLDPGKYAVSVSTTGNCQFNVQWNFCDNVFNGTVSVNNGTVEVGTITIC